MPNTTVKAELTHRQLVLLMRSVDEKMNSLIDSEGEFHSPAYEGVYKELLKLYFNVLTPLQSEFKNES